MVGWQLKSTKLRESRAETQVRVCQALQTGPGGPLQEQQVCSALDLRKRGSDEGLEDWKIPSSLNSKTAHWGRNELASLSLLLGKLPTESTCLLPTVHDVGLLLIVAFQNVTKNKKVCDLLPYLSLLSYK